MVMKNDADIQNDERRKRQLFTSLTNHTPPQQSMAQIEVLRVAAKDFGADIIAKCPDSRERAVALTKLEESLMWAVKSLVLPES